jgi:hypothetical protein
MLSSAQAEFDVWGFGCVLYQLCTGRPLFMEIDSSDDNIIDDKRARLALRNWTEIDNERLSFVFEEEREKEGKGGAPGRSMSAELAQDLIRECLRGDPKERLASMAQVLAHPFLNEEARTAEITRRASLEEVGTRGATRKGNNAKDAADALTPTKVYPDGSYAVLIGINDYESSGISPDEGGMADLKSARQDAELVRDTLRARGFTILGELYDKDATPVAIRKLLSKIKKTLKGKKQARFVLFLASHGHQDEDDDGWICAHGCDRTALEDTCIEMQALKDFAKRLDCAHQLFLLDCCHAGSLLVGTRGAPSKFEVAMLKSPAVYGMTAVTKDQLALEVGGHGIFTKLLVDGLNGKVGVFSRRERGHVTATELFSYVQRGVLEAAGKKGREQTPKFEPLWQMHKGRSCDGQVLFFSPPPPVAGAEEAEVMTVRSPVNAVRARTQAGPAAQ